EAATHAARGYELDAGTATQTPLAAGRRRRRPAGGPLLGRTPSFSVAPPCPARQRVPRALLHLSRAVAHPLPRRRRATTPTAPPGAPRPLGPPRPPAAPPAPLPPQRPRPRRPVADAPPVHHPAGRAGLPGPGADRAVPRALGAGVGPRRGQDAPAAEAGAAQPHAGGGGAGGGGPAAGAPRGAARDGRGGRAGGGGARAGQAAGAPGT